MFDLAIFTVIAMILDIVLGLQGLFGVRTYLALSIPILLLLFRRWGKGAIISAALIAIVHLFLYPDIFYIRLANALGIVSLSVVLLYLQTSPMKQTRVSYGSMFLYFTLGYTVMFLIESMVIYLFIGNINLLLQLINHGANIIISLGLLSIIYVQKVLFVSMPEYLKETSEKEHNHE